MGRTYLFECPKCGYRAKVSGGADRGFHFAVRTILCADCRELYDAVTEFRPAAAQAASHFKGAGAIRRAQIPARPPTFLAAMNRLPPSGAKPTRWLRFAPACPVSPWHRVRQWHQPDRCPRCGLFLERGAVPFRIWD